MAAAGEGISALSFGLRAPMTEITLGNARGVAAIFTSGGFTGLYEANSFLPKFFRVALGILWHSFSLFPTPFFQFTPSTESGWLFITPLVIKEEEAREGLKGVKSRC